MANEIGASSLTTLARSTVAEYLGVASSDEGSALMRQIPVHRSELFEVVPLLERRLGITFGEGHLKGVRTYADLVALAEQLASSRAALPASGRRPPIASVCIEPPASRRGSAMVRSGHLTGYFVETIVEDAIYAGRGTQVRVLLPASASPEDLVHADRALARARRRGAIVEVSRHDGLPLVPDAYAEPAALEATRGVRTAIDLAAPLGEVLHALEQERGAAALYLASGGRKLGDELGRRRRATQPAIEAFRTFIREHEDTLPTSAREHGQEALRLLDRLDDVRHDAESLATDLGTMLRTYTQANRELLDAATAIPAATPDAASGRMAKGFLALLRARETAALEHAHLAYALESRSFEPELPMLLASLIAAQESLLDVFTATAPPEAIVAYRQRRSDPAFDRVARLERAALRADRGAGPAVGADEWYQAMSAKLARIREVEDVHLVALSRRVGRRTAAQPTPA
jgi:nitrate/nitrite sensing protein